MKNNIAFLIVSLLLINLGFGQAKSPYMLRLQDKYSKKKVNKYTTNDTLISTSNAVIHISYSNDFNKPTLLLLHGMGANARINWSKQLKTLSKKFNLILPDLIYFGESTSSSKDYSVEFQAQQIFEALIKLGFTKKINVMGFSYGALTAAVYNELFQSSVNKLIIIDGPVKFYSTAMADSIAKINHINGLRNIIAPNTIEGFNVLKKLAFSKRLPLTRKIKLKIIKYYFLPTKEIRDKQMNYLTEKEAHYQTLNYNLDKTSTLLIWGGIDGVIPVNVGIQLHQVFPSTTKLVVFPKTKHDVIFNNPKKLNKTIIKFLTESS
ncbi:MAG: alpha/beta hydrolase [Bacteroidota bacterium]|jgi:pimeloyl-ACP methyl ester carboxylesterase